jgi:hypothetical protein
VQPRTNIHFKKRLVITPLVTRILNIRACFQGKKKAPAQLCSTE